MTGGILFFVAAVVGAFIVMVYKANLKICQPSEVLIFSGRIHRDGRGQARGYRIIKGGRAFRLPLIETVDRLDLTNMAIDLHVRGAYSKGGIPLEVQGMANVKIAGDAPVLHNAVERFIGFPQTAIVKIAKETLEGSLRGVLATLTPEQVNEDKIKFAESLLHEAEHDMGRLGLLLDTVKIQNVTDDVGYLNSIGRKKSAELQKHSLIAEANTHAEAAIRAAQNEQVTALSQLEAEMKIAYAEAQRQITDAQTRKEALVAEEQGAVAKLIAQAQAELQVQVARVEQQRRKLAAEMIEPARAQAAAAEAAAKADAAKILENGRAAAQALDKLAETWKAAGPDAKDMVLLQKLDSIVTAALATVGETDIESITVLEGGRQGTALAASAVGANEQIKAALGIDLAAVARRLAKG